MAMMMMMPISLTSHKAAATATARCGAAFPPDFVPFSFTLSLFPNQHERRLQMFGISALQIMFPPLIPVQVVSQFSRAPDGVAGQHHRGGLCRRRRILPSQFLPAFAASAPFRSVPFVLRLSLPLLPNVLTVNCLSESEIFVSKFRCPPRPSSICSKFPPKWPQKFSISYQADGACSVSLGNARLP